jgi:catechol-2,3-dioxygenase
MEKPNVKRTHIALYVRDPVASGTWYEEVLGMEETARGENWVFMSFGTKHHDIALIRTDETRPPIKRGLQHYGLEIGADVTYLRRLYGMLLRKNVEVVKTTDHKIGYGLYFNDPDGNRLEFFCDLVFDDGEGKRLLNEYHAPSDPIDLKPLFD